MLYLIICITIVLSSQKYGFEDAKMKKRRITEQKLKTLSNLDVDFLIKATRVDEGYTVTISSDDVGLSDLLYETSRGIVRTFKTVDAIIATCERIGMNNYSLKVI